ncbi:hypothetical protein Dd1591_3893 [Dickeya chrysanthemi Ech1591]|uniref:Uncharacterized protein n=1 Tax=Dickeya chrysanthemi (strain Ech1591) TaxID=561229 RepID=C6CNA0_DICC1|nr:hypothetical protein Dd1591_3893 [Dickeya chrysanthemi Ech1591]
MFLCAGTLQGCGITLAAISVADGTWQVATKCSENHILRGLLTRFLAFICTND